MVEFMFVLPPLPTLEPPQAPRMSMPPTAKPVINRANNFCPRLRAESQRIEFFMANLPKAPSLLVCAALENANVACAAQSQLFALLLCTDNCRWVKTDFRALQIFQARMHRRDRRNMSSTGDRGSQAHKLADGD
jgi:hypothetical protein